MKSRGDAGAAIADLADRDGGDHGLAGNAGHGPGQAFAIIDHVAGGAERKAVAARATGPAAAAPDRRGAGHNKRFPGPGVLDGSATPALLAEKVQLKGAGPASRLKLRIVERARRRRPPPDEAQPQRMGARGFRPRSTNRSSSAACHSADCAFVERVLRAGQMEHQFRRRIRRRQARRGPPARMSGSARSTRSSAGRVFGSLANFATSGIKTLLACGDQARQDDDLARGLLRPCPVRR